MVSNNKKEPIFLLERIWDDKTKLPEKYKVQGANTQNRAEFHIDSGMLGINFFLKRTRTENTRQEPDLTGAGLSLSLNSTTS